VAIAVVLTTAFWLGLFSYKHLDDAEWWRFTLHDNASRFLRASIAVAIVALAAAAPSLAQQGAASTHCCSPLSVYQAAARGGLAEMIGTSRSRVGLCSGLFAINAGERLI
jgi:lysylphosphatidylglycerol synthetase-like protein (DUF2156 family)